MTMKHKEFKSVAEFLEFFNLPKKTTRRVDETAYFEFKPYEKDDTTIRAWIKSISNSHVSVTFKYKMFDLGDAVWDMETAEKHIKDISYYYEE